MSKTSAKDNWRNYSKPDGKLLPIGTSVVVLRPSMWYDAVGVVEKHVDGLNHVKLNSRHEGEYYFAQLPGAELEPYI